MWDRDLLQQIFRFGLVGVIGFLVDAGVLAALINLFDTGPFWPRAVSFPTALCVTWYLNSKWTFAAAGISPLSSRSGRYVLVQILGVLVNYLVYTAVLLFSPFVTLSTAIAALALASFAGMFVNFFGARSWVFRTQKQKADMRSPIEPQPR